MNRYEEVAQSIETAGEKASADQLYDLAQVLKDYWTDQPDSHLPSGGSYDDLPEEERKTLDEKLLNKRRTVWFTDVVNLADQVRERFVEDPQQQAALQTRSNRLFHTTSEEHSRKQDMTQADVDAGNELLDLVMTSLKPHRGPEPEGEAV